MGSRVLTFKIDADIRNTFLICVCGANRKASSKNQEASFEEVEGFLQRTLALYAHQFPENSAASLMDLPELHLGLPELSLSRKSDVNELTSYF